MKDETANLVLEILREMQGDLASLNDEVRLIQIEITAMKREMRSFTARQAVQDSDIGTIELRLDRIERRLDLAE